MNGTTTATATVAALASLIALGAQSATIAPDLQAAIAGMDPGAKVDVIISCADPVDPAAIRDPRSGTKRAKLIKALRDKANLCDRLLAKGLASAESESEKLLWLTNSVAATVRVGKIDQLARRPGVARVSMNRKIELIREPATPVPTGQPGSPGYTFWNLSDIRIPDLWALGHYGAGVVVGTLDTGVDLQHQDIAANWRGGANSWFDPSGEHLLPADADGHGTEVMGLLIGGNSAGVDIGAAPGAQWIAAKIFDDSGMSTIARVHQAYQWMLDPDGNPATDDAPDIVNNSWALPETNACHGEFAADIAVLKAADIAVVFSAGNFGPGAATSVEPANDPGSLSAGSVDSYQSVVLSSSRGPSACGGGFYPRLVAPGKSVFTTGLTSGGAYPQAYVYATGTSFAAPHVAGAMAVLKGAAPGATVAQLEAALEGAALDLGTLGPDNDSGAGYIDVAGSYLLLTNGSPILPGDLQFSAANYSVNEGGTSLSVTVTRTGGSSGSVGVDYTTANGTATATSDYAPASGTLSFADGETSRTFTVTVIDDALHEGDEDLFLNLSNPSGGAWLGAIASGVVVIVDNDPVDTDGDGVMDATDQCPGTPLGAAVDGNGCAASQRDGDGDGVSDALDLCPGTPTGAAVDGNGCAASQRDGDGDGVSDALDLCPGTPAGTAVDAVGCPVPPVNPTLLYLSLEGNGILTDLGPTGTNLAYADEDVLSWNGNNYAMVFDGSAAGLAVGADIVAFDMDPANNRILMAFRTNQTVPGVGAVTGADIVAFDLGSRTFSLVFDGSDVGLTTSPGEYLDALQVLPDGRLIVSTRGNPSVPGLSGLADEDLLVFAPTSLGANTSGAWVLYFDGSDVGLTTNDAEDVDAAAVAANGDIYLSTLGNFSVAGLSGQNEDVFVCKPKTLGATTACSGFSVFFDGTAHGLSNEDVDAIDLP